MNVAWAVVNSYENTELKKKLVNLNHVILIRKTEESDGDYHKKHGGKGLVFLYKHIPFNIEKPLLEDYGVVGELLNIYNGHNYVSLATCGK